jgi:hypothetical protein
MKLKIPLGVIIGFVLAFILLNMCVWTANNHLKNTIMSKDNEIIRLHRRLDSIGNKKHIYELDLASRQAYKRQTFCADTFIMNIDDSDSKYSMEDTSVEYPEGSRNFVPAYKIIKLPDSLEIP